MSMVATWLGLALAVLQAPTAEELGCVVEGTTDAERAAITAGIRSGGIEPATIELMAGRALNCTPRFGWDSARGTIMTMAGIATVARRELAADLGRQGIEPAIVDRWFSRQSEALRTNMQIDEAQAGRIVLELRDAGIPAAALDAHERTVGQYVGTLMFLERVRLGLPLD